MLQKGTHEVFQVKDLLELEDDPNRWIVPDMIPRAGRTMVFGQGGTFKSTIIFDLAVAVTSQHFLFQQFTVNSYGPVLVNSTEGNIFESKRRILAHARAHQVNPASIPLHFCQQPFLLDDPMEIRELEETIAEIEPILVVLDPLDSFFSGDENSAKETKAVRREIDRLIREYNCAFIIIHHETKSSDKPTPRGSGAWYGWVDSVLHIKAKKFTLPGLKVKQNVVEVNSLKQRNGETGHVFSGVPNIDKVLDIVTFTFYDGKDFTGIVNVYLKREIYKVLREYGVPMTNQMVADSLGLRPEKLSMALNDLERDALIAKDATVERPFGKDGAKTRRVPAWRALPRRTVVDDAIIMAKSERRYEEELQAAYELLPVVPDYVPVIEAGDPEPVFEVIDSQENADASRAYLGSVGLDGSGEGT